MNLECGWETTVGHHSVVTRRVRRMHRDRQRTTAQCTRFFGSRVVPDPRTDLLRASNTPLVSRNMRQADLRWRREASVTRTPPRARHEAPRRPSRRSLDPVNAGVGELVIDLRAEHNRLSCPGGELFGEDRDRNRGRPCRRRRRRCRRCRRCRLWGSRRLRFGGHRRRSSCTSA